MTDVVLGSGLADCLIEGVVKWNLCLPKIAVILAGLVNQEELCT